MFFLISYGLINYATFFEARAAGPWFRPRFHFFHRNLSLLGALGCLGAMLAIDLEAGLIAVTLMFAIYEYLRRSAPEARWADGRRSYHTQQLRSHLLAAAREPEHPRDWRPNILLFSDDRERRGRLLRLAAWFEGDSGFATAVKILEGEGVAVLRRREEVEAALEEDIKATGVAVFPLVIVTPDLDTGLQALVQGFGIGHLKANIVLLNWLEAGTRTVDERSELTYGHHLRTAFRLGCNLVVLDGEQPEWAALDGTAPAARRIDVWWRNDASSRLMLLLAYLLTRTKDWDEARIRLLGMRRGPDDEETAGALQNTLREVRIEAEVKIVEQAERASMIQQSTDASLVFLPFRLRGDQPLGPFDEDLDDLLKPLPVAVMVLAAEDIDLDAEPEEGAAAEIARVLDALSDAERVAELTARDAEETGAAVLKARAELEAATVEEETSEDIAKLTLQLQELEARHEKARRRAARKAAKAQAAHQDAESLGLLESAAKDETGSGSTAPGDGS
jgi:hypothetical protein